METIYYGLSKGFLDVMKCKVEFSMTSRLIKDTDNIHISISDNNKIKSERSNDS